MKKHIILLFLLIIAFMLSACLSSKDKEKKEEYYVPISQEIIDFTKKFKITTSDEGGSFDINDISSYAAKKSEIKTIVMLNIAVDLSEPKVTGGYYTFRILNPNMQNLQVKDSGSFFLYVFIYDSNNKILGGMSPHKIENLKANERSEDRGIAGVQSKEKPTYFLFYLESDQNNFINNSSQKIKELKNSDIAFTANFFVSSDSGGFQTASFLTGDTVQKLSNISNPSGGRILSQSNGIYILTITEITIFNRKNEQFNDIYLYAEIFNDKRYLEQKSFLIETLNANPLEILSSNARKKIDEIVFTSKEEIKYIRFFLSTDKPN